MTLIDRLTKAEVGRWRQCPKIVRILLDSFRKLASVAAWLARYESAFNQVLDLATSRAVGITSNVDADT